MKPFSFLDPAFVRKLNTGGGGGGGSTVLLADLVGYWRMNESTDTDAAADATGNGNNIPLISGPASVETGKIDGARRNTNGNHFQSSDSAAYAIGEENFSAFGWLKDETPSTGATYHPGFKLGYPSSEGALQVYSTDISGNAAIRLLAVGIIDFAGTPFYVAADTTAWTFWAAGYITAAKKYWLSVNGAARIYRSVAGVAVLSTPNRIASIGEMFGGVDGVFNDSIGWRKGLLNDAQISWLWNGGAGRDITA